MDANTHTDHLVPGILPAPGESEIYDIIPSKAWDDFDLERFAVSLDDYECRQVVEMLRKACPSDAGPYPDPIFYKGLAIEAVHRLDTHEEAGGDSYCGVWEKVEVIDRDTIEVVGVYDEDGNGFPAYVKLLNRCLTLKNHSYGTNEGNDRCSGIDPQC